MRRLVSEALFKVFHDGWNNFVNGHEGCVGNADWIHFDFKQTEAENWGLAVDESNGEMVISVARDKECGERMIAMEVANEMPILRCCSESALTILAVQLRDAMIFWMCS